jgi:hypothetical protein
MVMRSCQRAAERNARWANLPLEVRFAHSLAALRFATEELRLVIDQADAGGTFPDLADASAAISELLRPLLRHVVATPAGDRVQRDEEIAEVLDRLGHDLAGLKELRGPHRDEELARIEAIAAPYALVFYNEVCRMDDVVAFLMTVIERPSQQIEG